MPPIIINLNNSIPPFGLGTFLSLGNEVEESVKYAIDIGYRYIDTAYFYQNEINVGNAIRSKISEGIIQRKDVFLVTKLASIHHEVDKVEYACRLSLKNLQLEYIDLYLMHFPVGYCYVNDNNLQPKNSNGVLMLNNIDYLDTWKAMENLLRLGLVRNIGISNFNSEQIDRLLKNCSIKPIANQIECTPFLNQRKLIKFCNDRNIKVIAYTPLGRPRSDEKKPDFIYSEKTKILAEKYNKTPVQIVLRYLVDIGTIPIPKSANKNRIKENLNIFDFKLSEEDIKIMDSFNTGKRLITFDFIGNHEYYPFSIEF